MHAPPGSGPIAVERAQQQQVLLELALSLGGESDPDRLLATSLPLLVRRTGSMWAVVVADDPDQGIVHISPAAVGDEPATLLAVEAAEELPADRVGSLALEGGLELHVLPLPGFGRLLLARSTSFPRSFLRGLASVAEVLARALVAEQERQRRERAESTARRLGDQHRALLDSLPFPAWLTDGTGSVDAVNPAFCAWLGRSPERIIGRRPRQLLPGTRGALAERDTLEVLATGRAASSEESDTHDGRSYRVDRMPYRDATGRVIGVVGFRRDISEERSRLSQIRQQAEFQELLMELAVGFVNVPLDAIDTELTSALGRVGVFTGVDRAYVFDYDLAGGLTSNTHEWCAPGIEPQIDALQDVPLELVPDWVDVHLRGEAMLIDDVQALPEDSGVRQVLEPQGVKTLLALPLMAGSRCVGFVGFDAVARLKRWSWREQQLLRVLAELVTNALERESREGALREARRRAEEANRAKTRFLSAVSHELRTPLNGILGLTELLSAELDEPGHLARLEGIASSAGALADLVNDLLDIARIEQGALELRDEPFDLHAVVAGAARIAAPEDLSGRRQLTVRIGDGVPVGVVGDPLRVRQVVVNLVGNAWKFTERGTVTVALEARAGDDEQQAWIELMVEDTGIGMTPETLEHLFEPFYRGDDPADRNPSGTGLGLAVVSDLVELFGGTVAIDSELGRGTRVTAHFPIRVAADDAVLKAAPDATAAHVATDDGQRVSILAAEDNPINRQVLAGYLADTPYELELVDDGEQAVAAVLDGGAYDLVLMDCFMPVMDGLTATRHLREQGIDAERLPIVAVTADASASNVAACREAGMDAVVTKPYQRDTMLAVIDRVLRPRRTTAVGEPHQPATTRPAEPAPAAATQTDLPPVFDPGPVRQLAARQGPDGTSLADRLVGMFVDRLPTQLEELREADDDGDTAVLHRGAHTLKSNAAMLGLLRLSERCRVLEQAARDLLTSDEGQPGSLQGLLAELEAEVPPALEALTTW